MQGQTRMRANCQGKLPMSQSVGQIGLPVAYYYPVSVGHGPEGRAEHGTGNT